MYPRTLPCSTLDWVNNSRIAGNTYRKETQEELFSCRTATYQHLVTFSLRCSVLRKFKHVQLLSRSFVLSRITFIPLQENLIFVWEPATNHNDWLGDKHNHKLVAGGPPVSMTSAELVG